MLRNDIYKIAFELVVEATVNHQKMRETGTHLLYLANYLDAFFDVHDFNLELNNKSEFYKGLLENDDEALFIHDSHIPYLVQTEKLCSENDRLLVYLIIQGWVQVFEIPNELIYKKIAGSLNLSRKISEFINGFIDGKITTEYTEYYLKIRPENSIEKEKLEGEWIEENKPENLTSEDTLTSTKIGGNTIHAIFLQEYNSFAIKCGNEPSLPLVKNSFRCPDKFCLIQTGDVLSIGEDTSLDFTDLKKTYIEKRFSRNYYLTALNAESNYRKKNGIREFNFIGQPGELIGVIGKEGSGKSTLLSILAGTNKPQKGNVFINGYDLYKNSYQLSGFVGYVPEEDLLYHELSVRDNLVISAKLYLGKTTSANVSRLVDNLLVELELWELRNEIIGKPKDKQIQPGQRRLLNIALELIRDPQILIIDNAISSLSMSDSSKVIEILAKFTFKGKLIITSITQTNHKTFELFDKLFIIDRGGIPVYFGTRHNAKQYFFNYLPEGIVQNFNIAGNITPEAIFDFLSIKRPWHESKNETEKYLDSETLYKNYFHQNVKTIEASRNRKKISGKLSHPPRLEHQYLIYSVRNFRTKIAQKKELYFALFAPPVLSFLISFALRSSENGNYNFGQNPNIPIFFFISSLIMFFVGLSMSVKEILSEQHVIKKEEHLNLSMFSYINSKITFLFIIVAIQSFAYTIVSNSILEIEQMFLRHWLVYFSVAISGALLGLIFSATHQKVESVLLKTAPVTLLVLIVFGGGWIPLKNISSVQDKYTPIFSDIVISRLAYETLVVDQYLKNPYQKNIDNAEVLISNGSFNSYNLLPKLKNYLEQTEILVSEKPDSAEIILQIIKKQFEFYKATENVFPFEFIDKLNVKDFNLEILNESLDYLAYLDYFYYKQYSDGLKLKQTIIDSLANIYGKDGIEKLKLKSHNIFISQIVRNSNSRESFAFKGRQVIRYSDPIYQKPENNYGRAPLFVSQKRFNNQLIDTLIFNLSIIWLINLTFYILLITGIANKLSLNFFSKNLS